LRAAPSYLLYWMIVARQARGNFALDRSIEHAHALRKPLVVFGGPLSAHQAFARVMRSEQWTKRPIAGKPATGAREGYRLSAGWATTCAPSLSARLRAFQPPAVPRYA
jgi:hypothetical protein